MNANENIYFLDGQRNKLGPFHISELVEKGITPDSLAWMPGLTAWTPAKQIPELADLFSKPEATVPAQPAQPVRQDPPATQPYQPQRPAQPYYNYNGEGPQMNVTPRRGNSVGVAAGVLALSLILVWIPLIGPLIITIVALILSIVGVCRSPRGMAVTGLIISVIWMIIWIWLFTDLRHNARIIERMLDF